MGILKRMIKMLGKAIVLVRYQSVISCNTAQDCQSQDELEEHEKSESEEEALAPALCHVQEARQVFLSEVIFCAISAHLALDESFRAGC